MRPKSRSPSLLYRRVALSATLLVLFIGQNAATAQTEGWYTEEQAERGQEAYMAHCARCHSPDLRARSTYISLYAYPALTGTFFFDRWEGQNVHTLFQIIQHTMPLDAPNSLQADTYADITAYILQANNFPFGEEELPVAREDPSRLEGFVIEAALAGPMAEPREVEAVELVMVEEPEEPEPAAEPEEPEEPEEEPEVEEAPEDEEWYTEAQALRGQDAYLEHCARCHGRALQGVGVAPSLAGTNFIDRWEGESVADLFWITSALMPLDDQGALDEETYADLVAFILQQNGFPSGETELPTDAERLDEFVIRPELAEVRERP